MTKVIVIGGGLVALGLAYLAWPALTDQSAAAADAQRIRLLEERVNALQSRLQAAQPSPNGSAERAKPTSPEEVQRAREESKRRHIEAHERTLKAHAAQPVDGSWAPQASLAFRADLEGVRQQSLAQVVGVDCRTNSCVATLTWPSFHDAKRGFSAVLHALYRVNCVKTITLPDPPDFSKPYTGSAVFLNCQKPSAQK